MVQKTADPEIYVECGLWDSQFSKVQISKIPLCLVTENENKTEEIHAHPPADKAETEREIRICKGEKNRFWPKYTSVAAYWGHEEARQQPQSEVP